jgi:hypothetical protein
MRRAQKACGGSISPLGTISAHAAMIRHPPVVRQLCYGGVPFEASAAYCIRRTQNCTWEIVSFRQNGFPTNKQSHVNEFGAPAVMVAVVPDKEHLALIAGVGGEDAESIETTER